MQEKTIDKIRKLLKLSESPNIHEAKRALAKAQELALKNGLSMDEIEETEQEAVEETFTPVRNRIPGQERIIAATLASNFRVVIIRHCSGLRETMRAIGMPSDVKIFRQVFAYTIKAYRGMLNGYLKKYKKDHPRRKINQALKNDYLRGFVMGLNMRFEQNIQEKALVITLPSKVQDAVMGSGYLPAKGMKLSTRGNYSAMLTGMADAKTLQPHRELQEAK